MAKKMFKKFLTQFVKQCNFVWYGNINEAV